MLVGYFFFNPLPYLSFTPPLNLKAQFSANWKSLFFSPSSLIYGGYGVGAKCTTHRPFPYALKSLSYPPPLPISSHSFSGRKEPFPLCDLQNILHRGNCPHPDLAPLLVSLVLFCSFLGALFLGGVWVIEQPWAFGDLNCFFFFSFLFIKTLNIQFQKTKNGTFH